MTLTTTPKATISIAKTLTQVFVPTSSKPGPLKRFMEKYYRTAILHNNMDVSWLMVYAQQI